MTTTTQQTIADLTPQQQIEHFMSIARDPDTELAIRQAAADHAYDSEQRLADGNDDAWLLEQWEADEAQREAAINSGKPVHIHHPNPELADRLTSCNRKRTPNTKMVVLDTNDSSMDMDCVTCRRCEYNYRHFDGVGDGWY